jgi:hypothetical protein
MNTSKASCQKGSPSLDNIDCQSKPIMLILPWVLREGPRLLRREILPPGNQNYASPTPPRCNYVIPGTIGGAMTPRRAERRTIKRRLQRGYR